MRTLPNPEANQRSNARSRSNEEAPSFGITPPPHSVNGGTRDHLLLGTHFWRYLLESLKDSLQFRGATLSAAIGLRQGKHENN